MAADIKKWLGGSVAESVVRIVVIASTILALFLFIRQDQFASCQARYDQAYATYAKETSENQNAVNDADDEFKKAFHEALLRKDAKTLDDVNKAFDNYFITLNKFKQIQQKNPPPALPEETCGTP